MTDQELLDKIDALIGKPDSESPENREKRKAELARLRKQHEIRKGCQRG